MRKYLLLTLLLSGCRSEIPYFSGNNAYQYLLKQCQFGPRDPGSKGHQLTSDFIVEQLAGADTVFRQPFTYLSDKSGKLYNLANIIARYASESEKQILISAHWDTRPWSDRDPDPEKRNLPTLGANDGASGVAVLLELAQIFNNNPPPFGVSLIFWDGEDLGSAGDNWSYARGSQYFAQNLPFDRPDYGINLDMVGDLDLALYIERISFQQNPVLVRDLWNLAKKLNLTGFRMEARYAVFDDHVPLFEMGGIPAINIIDFEYPNTYENYWHTQNDLPQYCSAQSLGQVGSLLIFHIYGEK